MEENEINEAMIKLGVVCGDCLPNPAIIKHYIDGTCTDPLHCAVMADLKTNYPAIFTTDDDVADPALETSLLAESATLQSEAAAAEAQATTDKAALLTTLGITEDDFKLLMSN